MNRKKASRSKVIITGVVLLTLVLLLSGVTTALAGNNQQDGAQPTPTATLTGSNAPVYSQYAPPVVPTPLPQVETYKNSARFSFDDLGVGTFSLTIPESQEIGFDLPNQWVVNALPDTTFLQLHYDFFFDYDVFYGVDDRGTNTIDRSGAPTISVYVDGILAETFIPKAGTDLIEVVPLPFDAFRDQVTYYTANEHAIEIIIEELDLDCWFAGRLNVHSDSFIQLGFEQNAAFLNLSNFPLPLIQDSFIPETINIVIPDDYSEADLNAAITVVNKVGRYSTGVINYNVVTTAQVNQTIMEGPLIAIGTPEKNGLVNTIVTNGYLNISRRSTGELINASTGEVIPDVNGVVQIIPSYTNRYNNYLVITGQTDEAVILAARALANLNPVNFISSLAIISPEFYEASVPQEEALIKDLYTFEELSQTNFTFTGRGLKSNSIFFYVPLNWQIQDDVKLILLYDYSLKLSRPNTAFNIVINDRPVGSISLMDETPGLKEVVIPLTPEFFIPGRVNQITFDVTLSMELECANWDFASFWVTIDPNSALYVPYNEVDDATNYPDLNHPFENLVYSRDAVYVVSESTPLDQINNLVQFAFRISRLQVQSQVVEYDVAFDTGQPITDFNGRDLAVIDKPSTSSIIQSISQDLPLSFVPGEDALLQDAGELFFRIQEDLDIGVVESIYNPNSPANVITVITGTTDKGVGLASDIIGNTNYPYDWNGYAFVVGEDAVIELSTELKTYQPLSEVVSLAIQQDVSLSAVDATPTPSLDPDAIQTLAADQYVSAVQPTQPTKVSAPTVLMFAVILIAIIVMVIAAIRVSRGGRLH